MAGISEYERLQIDSLLNRKPASIEPGVGLALLSSDSFSFILYESCIRPAMVKNDLSTIEIRQVFNSDSSLNDVCHWLLRAELIVADVTGLPSHLMYCLGLAHALGRCPILLAEAPIELPFNLQALRCLEFDRSTNGLYALRESLERAMRIFLSATRATRE